MTQLINYAIFYRRHGIRTAEQLSSPARHPLNELTLPANSIYHHIEFDGVNLGPNADHPALRGQIKAISLSCITELTAFEGVPKKLSFSTAAHEKTVTQKNRKLRLVRNMASVLNDQNTLVCINYNFLFHAWSYVRSQYSEIYKWSNALATVVHGITQMPVQNARQHFIMIGVPPVMPSVAQIQACQDKVGPNLVKLFNTGHAGVLLEIWKWLDPDTRHKSLLGAIPVNRLHLVNFIIQDSGQYSVINLGYLYAFCKQSPTNPQDPSQSAVIQPIGSLESFSVQKRLLVFIMKMMEKVQDQGLAAAAALGEEDQDTAEKKDLSSPLPNSNEVLVTGVNEQAGERELTQAELIAIAKEQEEEIDEMLSQLDNIVMRRGSDDDGDGQVSMDELKKAKSRTLEQAVDDVCMRLESTGSITAAQYRLHMKNAAAYKTIKNPFGDGTLEDMLVVKPEDKVLEHRTLPDQVTVHDKTMLQESLRDFDRKYIQKIMPKHLVQMTLAMQKAGYCVSDFTVEHQGDMMGEYMAMRVSVAPVEGSASTLNFKVPTVDEYGIVRSNDIDYRLKKLRVDIPIRKVSASEVALTSYYGKCFIYRGRKKSSDYGHWLRSKIMMRVIEGDAVITGGVLSPGFDKSFKAPKAFTDVSLGFSELTVRGYDCKFNGEEIVRVFGEDTLQKLDAQGLLPFGTLGGVVDRGYVQVDIYGAVSSVANGQTTPLGNMADFLDIPQDEAPVDYAEASVMGSDISVGVILAFLMGLSNLFKLLNITPVRHEAGKRFTLSPHEFAIKFLDETLVFSRQDALASLVVAGFSAYHKTCKRFSVHAFDKPAVYLNMFEAHGLTARHLREVELADVLFVDPITEEDLVEMKEPTNYQGLLIRACEMLLDDQYKNPTSLSEQRLRGYERIAGAIYVEMVRSIRQHKASPGKNRKKLEMSPYAVWKRVFEDPAKEQVVQINPLQELRHQESVTFSGEGGRSKQTMNWQSREFTHDDMGVISENTSDSSDVGINTYLSAAPNLTNLSGMTRRFDMTRDGATKLFSTSALCAPAYNHEDPKRINFIGIQKGHMLAVEGYHAPLYSTGYESVVGQRTSPRFCFAAPQPGRVTKIDDRAITVQYLNGEKQSLALGRQFGKAAGLVLPNDIVTPLKVGDQFKEGHAITYNTGFFEMDWLNPGFAVMKSYRICRVAIWESAVTFEDASALSSKFTKTMTTRVTEVRNITVKFTDEIRDLVKPGQAVEYDTVLCYILEESTSVGGFDDQTIKTLQMIDASAPKAGMRGAVDKVEVFYHGLADEMSKSLKKITKEFEAELAAQAASLQTKAHTANVGGSLRIEGESLDLDHVCIRIYITTDVVNGVGDKGVFSNQLKTVNSDIIEDPMTTEDGREIDAIFGGFSVMKRIVGSAGRLLTTNSILYYGSEFAANIYFGDDSK